jgi:hypothetical protein
MAQDFLVNALCFEEGRNFFLLGAKGVAISA